MGTWIFCSPDGLQSMGSQRVRHDWACTHSIQNDWCLYEKRRRWRHTGRRRPCGDGGRLEWGVYKPRDVKDHWQTTGASRKDSPLQISDRPQLCRPLSDLQPPELWDNEFLLFSATPFVALCYREASTPVSNFCAVPTSRGDPDFFSEPVLKLSLLEFCQGKCRRGFLPLTKACK